MRRHWFATVNDPFPVGDYAEVGLEHFAAMAGMTLSQYVGLVKGTISSGRLLDLLKFEARGELECWIVEKGYFDCGDPFCVILRLSLNKAHDDALFCVCTVESDEDGEAFLRVYSATPGLVDMPPGSIGDMDSFEIMFCDMETNLLGVENA